LEYICILQLTNIKEIFICYISIIENQAEETENRTPKIEKYRNRNRKNQNPPKRSIHRLPFFKSRTKLRFLVRFKPNYPNSTAICFGYSVGALL
jgi:hypothetical protein